MADVDSSEKASVTSTPQMNTETGNEECQSKQGSTTNNVTKEGDFKICSPSNPFIRSTSSNPFTSDHNKFGKSILKPSLLSVSSASSASSNSLLRQSSFNPFIKAANDNKSDTSDKKKLNGEVKFVPLIKNEAKLPKPVETTQSVAATNTSSTPSFVFGQNIQERVVADANASEPSTSTVTNGNSGTSDMLFSSAVKSDSKLDNSKDKETKSLTESAREYEESRANKRKYDEVQVKTGEEEETNVISISCKLFAFDKTTSNWQERGRGTLRLNDFEVEDGHIGSRLVFRTSGSLRVVLNTKIWAEMTVDKASEKSIRLTALDSSGEIKVFLIMSNIDDSRQLYSHLTARLEKEIALQKRKKNVTNDSGEK